MNVFVTGGAGYIGSATAKALLKAGHSITIYDSLVTGHREAVPEGARFIQEDLSDAATLSRTAADGSPSRSLLSFSYSTRGTSTWMSIRSSNGPEMRFWYFVTTIEEQVQGLTGSPK